MLLRVSAPSRMVQSDRKARASEVGEESCRPGRTRREARKIVGRLLLCLVLPTAGVFVFFLGGGRGIFVLLTPVDIYSRQLPANAAWVCATRCSISSRVFQFWVRGRVFVVSTSTA